MGIMMDPLMIAHPPSGIPFEPTPEDEAPFDTYCIVCDKRIPPLSSCKGEKKKAKKSKAGGTIRVKNADGTTTTRNAKGKVTRPPLRNSNSSSQSTTTSTTTTPLPPLARPKTTDGTIPTSTSTAAGTVSSPEIALPSTSLASTFASTPGSIHSTSSVPTAPPFHSPIYCSRECQAQEAGRSDETYKELARTMSFDFSHAFHSPEHELELVPVPIRDRERGVRSPFAPPSPVGTGSDTESSNSAGLQGSSGEEGEPSRAPRGGAEEAASAPKIMDYFRFSKGGPDQAWKEVSLSRQRRSSMQPSAYGAYGHTTPGGQSESGSEMNFARSMSGGGRLRGMTPVTERRASGVGASAERAVPIPVRPLARSNLSQTSLGANGASVSSQHSMLPPEFGSAPTHTLGLLQSYASAFPVRSSCNTPNSFSQRGSTPQRGFIFPEAPLPPTTSATRSPSPPDYETLRRDSASSISRSQGGTIKAKRSEPTWDSFGREEVQAQSARQNRRSGGGGGADSTPVAVPRRGSRTARDPSVGRENTPRQKMEKDGQGWRYVPSTSPPVASGTGVGRSGTVRRKSAEEQSRAVQIGHGRPPQLSTSSSGYTPGSHTPSSSRFLPTRATLAPAEPDMAGLTLGEAGEKMGTVGVGMGQSVPKRIGFNWDETMGVKTYELPGKVDKNQKGLFYFQ
ncbi:hypothetical protein IAR50_007252 [Cryptococcus sp. DSM 104548]